MNLVVAATLNSGRNDGGFRTEPGEHLVVSRPLKGGGNDRQDESHETYIVARALTAPTSPRYDGDTENFVVSPFVKTTRPHFAGDVETWADGHVSPTLNGWESGESRAPTLIAHALTAEGHDASEDGAGRGVPLAYALRRDPGGVGQAHNTNFVAGAMTVRRLTPVEGERLMGLPDNWTAIDGDRTPDSPRYRAIGNGMAVPVVEWICRRVVDVTRRARDAAWVAQVREEIAAADPMLVAAYVSQLSRRG